MMLTIETGRGRAIAYAADTWVWARTALGRPVHRKFWRQVIFWLAHKENQGEDQVKIAVDRRRAGVGQSVELTVTGRNAKGEPLTDVVYETKVEREGPTPPPSEPVDLYTRGDEWKGSYAAVGEPGDYKVTVVAKRNGQEVGRDAARFLVYQDDRELENPAAEPALAKQIAEITGGASVPPEQLVKYLKSLDHSAYTEYVSPTEHRVWDNWPFFLLFTLLLTAEWWLRKRHGWV
jgi:hypothetical protein